MGCQGSGSLPLGEGVILGHRPFTPVNDLHPSIQLIPHDIRAQRHLQQHGSVHITALGTALSSLVTLSEVLKNSKLVDEVKLTTCLEHFKDEFRYG